MANSHNGKRRLPCGSAADFRMSGNAEPIRLAAMTCGRDRQGPARGGYRPPQLILSATIVCSFKAPAHTAWLALRKGRSVVASTEEHTSELHSLLRISYAFI